VGVGVTVGVADGVGVAVGVGVTVGVGVAVGVGVGSGVAVGVGDCDGSVGTPASTGPPVWAGGGGGGSMPPAPGCAVPCVLVGSTVVSPPRATVGAGVEVLVGVALGVGEAFASASPAGLALWAAARWSVGCGAELTGTGAVVAAGVAAAGAMVL